MPRKIAIEYIKNTRQGGYSDINIRKELEKAGWPATEIDLAFVESRGGVEAPPVLPIDIPMEPLVQKAPTPLVPVISVASRVSDKFSRAKTITITGILFILFASGSGAGYWYYKTTFLPQQIFNEGIAALKNIKSYRYDIGIEIQSGQNPGKVSRELAPFMPQVASLFVPIRPPDVDTDGSIENTASAKSGSFKFTIRAKGENDYHDSNRPKGRITLALGTEPWLLSNIELESKLVDGTYYFQFTKLPYFDSRAYGDSVAPLDTKFFEGKWVALNPAKFKNDVNEYLDKLSAVDRSFYAYRLDAKNTADIISDRQTQEMRALWDRTQFIGWQKDLFEENLKNVPSIRAKGTLEKAEVERFLEDVAELTGKTLTETERARMHEALSSLGDMEINIWIDKKSKSVNRLSANTTGVFDLIFTMDISDIDKPVTIEAPPDAYDFKNILGSAFDVTTKSLETARSKGRYAGPTSKLYDIKP